MDLLRALRSGQLAGQTRLDLSCGLTEFPMEILTLADSLEILDLSNNRLSSLPDAFSQLKKLKIVFFTNNQFDTFPSVLAACPNLSMISFKGNRLKRIDEGMLSPAIRWLILTNNQIEELPEDIGQLSTLKKLMLAGNQLTTLPQTLADCQNLELIRVSENRLSTLPNCLFKLPRLAWLAYSGNPCSNDRNCGDRLPMIDWSELSQGDVLGQGASGIIYKGTWISESSVSPAGRSQKPSAQNTGSQKPSAQNTGHQDVAIKLFKGSITSDGSPTDEMQTCMAAGQHPHLMTALGKLTNAPNDQAGLVFPFVTHEYHNLGNPPSFESCTRDTYPEKTVFTAPMMVAIAQNIASAVAHLHRNGIMHGDLYAHNILVNETGNSILGDFGAASFYDRTNTIMAEQIERLEVRAFGYLLEDLLDHYGISSPLSDYQLPDAALVEGRSLSDDSSVRHPQNRNASDRFSQEDQIISIFRQLQQACLQPTLTKRPTFSQICQMLNSLQ